VSSISYNGTLIANTKMTSLQCVYSHVSTQGVPPKTSSVASSGTISPSGRSVQAQITSEYDAEYK
jgi:hypothetical protein